MSEDSLVKADFRSLAVLLLFFTVGCATLVTPEQIATADYGTVPVSSLYQKAIQDLVQQVLLEPFPPRLRFMGEPQKGYVYLSGRRQPPVFGYILQVGISARNLRGDYGGEELHRFFIKDETLYLLKKSDLAEVVP